MGSPYRLPWIELQTVSALFSSLTARQNVQFPMREYLSISEKLMDEKVLAENQAGQLEGIGAAKCADTLPKLIQTRLVQSFQNAGSSGKLASRLKA